MLTEQVLEQILSRIPRLSIGVVGDLFLDRYLDIDATLTEPSLETGLDAYQVVGVRSYPGAAGTVINNLVDLGVKKVCAISVIGDDGEGYELRRALSELGIVDTNWVYLWESRRTPTYVKPLLKSEMAPARELNRLDIKNRLPLPTNAEDLVIKAVGATWNQVDALVVSDQVREDDCGVVTAKVRERLTEMGEAKPDKVILADSRERIGHFRSVWLKPNQTECRRALRPPIVPPCEGGTTGGSPPPASGGGLGWGDLSSCVQELARRAGRPVFCTRGERGISVADPRFEPTTIIEVPAYPVIGPIDTVGAGDSTNAAIVCALATGADLEQAAAFGCLVASITIQQIGVTGTATPEQIRRHWQEVSMDQ